jgi:hypothetical protein
MATESLVKKSLALSFQEGIDEDAKPIIKRYSYSNIDTNATAANLLETAQAIASLSKGEALEFTAVDTNALLP